MGVAAHILAATLAWCLTTINTKPGFYPPGLGSAGSCAQLRSPGWAGRRRGPALNKSMFSHNLYKLATLKILPATGHSHES